MSTAKVILLVGRPSSGKTTTMILVLKKLGKPVCEPSYLSYHGNKKNFAVVQPYEGKNIAFIGHGDKEAEVKTDLDLILKLNVPMIVACTRDVDKENSVLRLYKDYAENKQLEIVHEEPSQPSKDKARQKINNDALAEKIIDKLREFIAK